MDITKKDVARAYDIAKHELTEAIRINRSDLEYKKKDKPGVYEAYMTGVMLGAGAILGSSAILALFAAPPLFLIVGSGILGGAAGAFAVTGVGIISRVLPQMIKLNSSERELAAFERNPRIHIESVLRDRHKMRDLQYGYGTELGPFSERTPEDRFDTLAAQLRKKFSASATSQKQPDITAQNNASYGHTRKTRILPRTLDKSLY